MNSQIEVRLVAAAEVVPLRQSVLRPGRPPETAVFDGDHEPSAAHFAAFQGPQIVGVASIFQRPFPLQDAPNTVQPWQLRGMAVSPESQGQGCGRLLLDACVQHVRRHAGTMLWCNARAYACGFYRAASFEIYGEEFEIPDVGPHFVMALRIANAAST